ncbi:hypothetical protein DWV84_23955 [Blautia sp. AF13-16]|uniref:PF13754 domain-containing protein n=1 Tax=Blautia sp. AF13-16 TaxID=2292195 RepID=UPI000E54C944|nr:PF13754 domain-containing protein [Blautia sp. AF13-16]RHS11201.1 hypothetical protein DWV84_23955 [Blautia sp. AF13-16]
MVARLEGKVDGRDVLFTKGDGDVWETTVPVDIDGTYIVELTAWDEAGNYCFTTRWLLTFDPSSLCVHLIPCPYWAEVLPSPFYAELLQPICNRRC